MTDKTIEEQHDELSSLMIEHINAATDAAQTLTGKRCHLLIVAFPMAPDKSAEFFSVVNTFGNSPGGLLEIATHIMELAGQDVFVKATPKESMN